MAASIRSQDVREKVIKEGMLRYRQSSLYLQKVSHSEHCVLRHQSAQKSVTSTRCSSVCCMRVGHIGLPGINVSVFVGVFMIIVMKEICSVLASNFRAKNIIDKSHTQSAKISQQVVFTCHCVNFKQIVLMFVLHVINRDHAVLLKHIFNARTVMQHVRMDNFMICYVYVAKEARKHCQ